MLVISLVQVHNTATGGGLTLVTSLCSGVMVWVYPALLSVPDELGPENLSLM